MSDDGERTGDVEQRRREEIEERLARLESRIGELSGALLAQGSMVKDLQVAVERLRRRNRELEAIVDARLGTCR